MKLHFYKDPKGNFGDDLNPWLWPKLIGDTLDENANELFVGIGTLINHRLPTSPTKHIFGSGLGYGYLPKIDSSYIFHAVRGYKTAEALNLDSSIVITDPAILIRTVFYPKAAKKTYRFGFIPHIDSISNFDWESLCNDIGLRFISSHWDVERVMLEIGQCETILAEAMHGAIVADTLRVPWIPISCYGGVLDFKWNDWLSSLGMTYSAKRLTPLYALSKDMDNLSRLKIRIKQGLNSCGIWSKNWTPAPPLDTTSADSDRTKKELIALTNAPSFLSDEKTLESHTSRYLELIEAFNKSYKLSR